MSTCLAFAVDSGDWPRVLEPPASTLVRDSSGSGLCAVWWWGCRCDCTGCCVACPFDRYRHDPTGCASCAADHSSALKEAGCDAASIDHGCNGNYEQCFRVLDTLCTPEELGSPTSCQKCAHAHTAPLEGANCTQFFIDFECSGHHHHENQWEAYINELGCHLNGTWFSTPAEGECSAVVGGDDGGGGGSSSDGSSCLWKVKTKGRTVNASCVDGAVIAAVEKVRPACFTACPQPANMSSACYLHCLFDTMVGNATATPPVPAMPAADIIAPFTAAFKPDGCPSVV